MRDQLRHGRMDKIVLSGHSLGGALAVLGAHHFARHDICPVHAVVTFGTPKVGGFDFKSEYEHPRLGLKDRGLIKDNHLAARASGSGRALRDAILVSRKKNSGLLIEVEVDRLDQIPPVMEALPDIVLLDNFKPAAIRRAMSLIDGRAATEASGGVSLKTLPELARLGLDFISSGALVYQSRWVDIGLDWSTK